MRRLSFLLALVALVSVILAGGGGDAEAKTRRRKLKTRAAAAAAVAATRPSAKRAAKKVRTRGPVNAVDPTSPTSPDVIPRRLMIVGFDGRGAQVARGAAADGLRQIPSVHVVPLRPADAMRLGTAYGSEKTVGLAQRLNLTAVMYGKISQAKRDVRLTLLLANGEDGRMVGEIAFDARSLGALRSKLKTQLWSKLEPLIDRAASPGRPEAGESPVAEGEKPAAEVPDTSAERRPAPTEVPDTSAERRPPAAEVPETPAKRPPRVARVPGEVPDTSAERRPPPAAEVPDTSAERPGGGPGAEAGGGAAEEGAGGAPTGTGEAAGEGEGEGEAADEPGTARRHRAGAASPGDEELPEIEAQGPPESDRCSLAELVPGAGVMARRFNYRGEQRGALRAYSLFRAPVGRVEGTLYPFAGGPCRVSTGFGLHAAYERMGPVSSQLANRELGTQGSAYQVELVLRMVSGRLTLQPALGFLVRQYRVDGDVVPAADYRAVGGGLDAELRGRYLSLAAGASGRRIMGAGTLGNADWFPHWSGYAASAHLQVGVAMTDWIDVVAGGAAEYESFTFTVDENALNPNGVAAGAYDLYLQGTLSIRFRLGRGGSGAAAAARRPRSPSDTAVSSR